MKKARSWSHAFWMTNDETLAKKVFACSLLKQKREDEEKNSNYTGNCKTFNVTRKSNNTYSQIVLTK